MTDGTVVVPAVTGYNQSPASPSTGWWPDDAAALAFQPDMSLLLLRPDHTTTVQTVPRIGGMNQIAIRPFKAIPNGQGGLIVGWDSEDLFAYQQHFRAQVASLDASGAVVPTRGVVGGEWWDSMLLTDDGLLVTTSFVGGKVRMFSIGGEWTLLDSPLEVSSIVAAPGSGVTISYSDGTVTGLGSGLHLTLAQPVDDGTWLGNNAGGLVDEAGSLSFRFTNSWSEQKGLGANNAGFTCEPTTGDASLNGDKTSLWNEYYPLRDKKTKDAVPPPACNDFAWRATGASSTYFIWEQLAGHLFFDLEGNPKTSNDNPHQWALVRDSLRTGLDQVYVNTGGFRLTAAYRSPHRNVKIGGKPNSGHPWGVAGDMKPNDVTTSYMDKPTWQLFLREVNATNPIPFYTETWSDTDPTTQSHVHAAWENWSGSGK